MKNRVTSFLGILLLACGLSMAAFTAQAQSNPAPKDYVLIDPASPTDDVKKIEVVEFFSYACNHCNDLNPIIQKWAGKLPADVAFKRVPISGRGFYTLMARAYYSFEALDILDKIDTQVFDAIHKKNRPEFTDAKSLAKWVAAKGYTTEEAFMNAFNSFSVESKVKQGDLLFDRSGATGVPALVVDGKYRMTGENARSREELLAQTEKVVELRRTERKKK